MNITNLLEMIKLIIPYILPLLNPLFILTTLKNAFCIMIPLLLLSKYIKQDTIKIIFKNIGILCTLGMTKIPLIKDFWNITFEPYVICGLCNLMDGMKYGLIEGLQSDNNPNDKNKPEIENINFKEIFDNIYNNVKNDIENEDINKNL